MFASLPMYDWPETREYTDRFWQRLQNELSQIATNLPAQLDRENIDEQWQSDQLLLSQTCIYPLKTTLPKHLIVVGTPNYRCSFSAGGMYASAILVKRTDRRQGIADFAHSTLAFNSKESQSGFNALKSYLVEQQHIDSSQTTFFDDAIVTSSHRASMQAVADGSADMCAVDPVSWALAKVHEPKARQLRVLCNTQYSPALPLITNTNALPENISEEQWRDSVMLAYNQALNREAQQHLLLDTITHIPKSQYLELVISDLSMVPE